VSVANARLWQVRLLCAPKRQVDNAFFHVARMCPLAFLPNPVDLVVVAAQIEGRVNNREEKTAITAMPIALMRTSPRYAADVTPVEPDSKHGIRSGATRTAPTIPQKSAKS
jgi:hypothetical protein